MKTLVQQEREMRVLIALRAIEDSIKKDPSKAISKIPKTYGLQGSLVRILSLNKIINNKGSMNKPFYEWMSISPNLKMAEKVVYEIDNYKSESKSKKPTIKKSPKRAATNKWNKEDEQFLIDNYSTLGRKACAIELNRTIKSVEGKRYSLGLSKNLSDVGVKQVNKQDKQIKGIEASSENKNKCTNSKTISLFWGLFIYNSKN